MPTQAKREMIDSLVALLNKSNAVFITEYRGLTVKKISDCRKRIAKRRRDEGMQEHSYEDSPYGGGHNTCPEFDSGPNGYVLSYGDVAAVAKAIRDFSKRRETKP